MTAPKISVIMAVYNSEKFLRESIESVLNQSFRDFELIFVYDFSKDNSLKIIKEYMKKDKRIKLIINKIKEGPAEARNKGLLAAKGNYIAILDADDIALSKRFEKQYSFLESHTEIFLIGSSAIVIDEEGKRMGLLRKYGNPEKIRKKLEKSNCIIHPSVMFRRNSNLFYRKKFDTSEDYDLYLRILTDYGKIVNFKEPLIKYRISKDSAISTKRNIDFFFNKARVFYFQRRRGEKDDYENLVAPRVPTGRVPDYKRLNLETNIFVKLQDNKGRSLRRKIKEHIREYGLSKKMLLYYILSFFPRRIIYFVQENFS
jgi:glycosyltransferase involved in cell wall biosynthesis